MTITATDFFCGAGGSSTGLVAAGIEVRHAANHWKLALDTHNTNHPNTEHSLDDLQQAHPAWYPRTDIAWFSPSCVSHSLAKGRKRRGIHQLDLWGESGVDPAEERSRATMREVIEFSEYHRYEIVIVENVVDIRLWQFYETWLQAMFNLGYACEVLYLNAQFFGVPQSRDRFYAVFWKRGNRAPDLAFRPAALCPLHGTIHAVQAWKKPDFPWGRYGARRQYVYRCPQCGADVQPAVVPAAAVIDWSLSAPRIGERTRPLKPRTEERILAGLRKFGQRAILADLGHTQAEDTHKVIAAGTPLPTQTTRQTLALIEPFLTSQHDGRNPQRSLNAPLWCVTGMNNEQQLVVPPFGAGLKNSATDGYSQPGISINNPLTTIVAGASQHALVLPPFVMSYYGTNPTFSAVDAPLPTLRTVEHEALILPEKLLPDCGFRMLTPEELKLGMSFPDSYTILGSKRDQVRQIGNAVCVNVAQWIAQRCIDSLH